MFRNNVLMRSSYLTCESPSHFALFFYFSGGLLSEAKVSPMSDVLHMQILELLSVHDFTTQGGQIPASLQNDNLYETNNTTWDFLLMHTLSPSPARAKSALFLRYTRNANSGIFHAWQKFCIPILVSCNRTIVR